MQDIVRSYNETFLKDTTSCKELQSLMDKLLCISKVIKPARGFLNRMLEGLRSMGTNTELKAEGEFKKDILWFKTFSNSFNGCTAFTNWAGHDDVELHINASLMGLWAVWDGKFYSVALPLYVQNQNRIVVFEIVNVLVALRTWGH